MTRSHFAFAALSLFVAFALMAASVGMTEDLKGQDNTSHPMGLVIAWPLVWLLSSLASVCIATPAFSLALGFWSGGHGRWKGAACCIAGALAAGGWTGYLLDTNAEAFEALMRGRGGGILVVALIPATFASTSAFAMLLLAFTGHRFFQQKARPG